jgi:hypothetical protein
VAGGLAVGVLVSWSSSQVRDDVASVWDQNVGGIGQRAFPKGILSGMRPFRAF